MDFVLTAKIKYYKVLGQAKMGYDVGGVVCFLKFYGCWMENGLQGVKSRKCEMS